MAEESGREKISFLIEEMVTDALDEHPDLKEDKEIFEQVAKQFELISDFERRTRPEGQELSEEEEKEFARKAISIVLRRKSGKILLLGSDPFMSRAYTPLYGSGFNLLFTDQLSEGMGLVYAERPLVVLIDKDSYSEKLRNEVRKIAPSSGITMIPSEQRDFHDLRLVQMVSTLDSIISGSKRIMVNIVLIDKDPLSNDIAAALRTKGFYARVYEDEEQARMESPHIATQIKLEGLTRHQKRFLLEAAKDPQYKQWDISKVLNHIRDQKPVVDFRNLIQYAKALRDFRLEQVIMDYYCAFSGNVSKVRNEADYLLFERCGKDAGEALFRATIYFIAARNALKYHLNKGTGLDLHNRLMSKAFVGGYGEFLLGSRKSDYLTDDTFINYVLKRAIEYMTTPEEEFVYEDIFTKEQLERLKESIEEQLKITDENRAEKLETLLGYFANINGESKRLYRSISFDKIKEALGGEEKEVRIKIREKVKAVVESCLKDEDFGPRDLSSIVRKEYRVICPGRNPVFKIEATVMGIGSVDSIAKIFDYRQDKQGRPLKESAKAKKKREFVKEVNAADYFSRWGINRTVNFFFEEYDEFSALMMGFWGKNNLFDVVTELDELIKEEDAKGDAADKDLRERWHSQLDSIFASLMHRMAEVHARSPDVALRIKDRISDPTEDFEERLTKEVFRRKKKGETYFLQPFEQFGTLHLCNEMKNAVKALRQSCPVFAEYLEKAQPLQTKVACKDTSLKNWFTASSGLRIDIKPADLNPVDYGTIRNLPPQMDVGNAFVMINSDPAAVMHYSEIYFNASEKEVKKYNRKLEEIAANIAVEARRQFNRQDLCRKSARKHLPELAKLIEERLSDMAKGGEQNTKLKDGRINPVVVDAMKAVCRRYIKSLPREKEVSEQDVGYLKMFTENAIRFFKNLRRKRCYSEGDTTKEGREGKFDDFWEGMLASMVYKTVCNIGAYIDFIHEGLEEPLENIRAVREMAENGAVGNIRYFLEVYKGKIGTKAVGYSYTQERYDKLSQMADELGRFADCWRKLEDHMSGAGQQLILDDVIEAEER